MDFQLGGSAGRHIGCGTDLFTGNTIPSISISVWINTSSNGVIMSKDRAVNGTRTFLFQTAGNQLYWQTSTDGNNFDSLTVSASLVFNDWHHVVVTYNAGTSSGDGEKKIYIDGSEVADSPLATYAELDNNLSANVPIEIGRRGDGDRYFYDNMSQVCIFNYALDSNQVTYLYNLNNPMVPGAVNLTAPVAYWPLGDNGNPNSPGSFPNISVGADSVFEFDGTQAIDTPLIDLGIDASVSMWFNPDPAGPLDYVLLGYSAAGFDYVIRRSSGSLFVWIGPTFYGFSGFGSNVVSGDWNFLSLTKDRGEVTVYLKNSNGDFSVSRTETSWQTADLRFDRIGARSITPINLAFEGEISNVQAWDVTLSSTDVNTLYNNGQPLMTGTQPQESNLRAWYKLNQTANYDEGQLVSWTISKVGNPNYGGTNDGCYSLNPGLRWHDNNYATVGSNYFQWNSPAYKTSGNNIVLSSTGGQTATPFFGSELILEYSIDGGPWTLWFQKTTGQVGSTPVPYTIPSTGNLTVNNFIKVRARGVDEGGTGSLLDLYNIQISGGTFSYNENFNESQRYGFFANNGATGLQPPVEYNPEPSWQIPDNRSAYPQSFNFNGSSDYIDIGQQDELKNITALSISLWFNYDSIATSADGLVGRDSSTRVDGNWYVALDSSNSIRFLLKTANGQDALNSSTISANKWYHTLCVWNGTTMKIYLNGDLSNSITLSNATGTLGSVSDIVAIGRRFDSSGFLNGNASNVALWNSDQSSEISNIYNNGVPATSYTNNPVAWYKLDDTSIWNPAPANYWTFLNAADENDSGALNFSN